MASFMPGNIGENLYQFCHPIIITGWPQWSSMRCNMPNKTKSYCLYKPLILLQMTHMLLPQMLERKRGVIINVCSSVSCVPPIPLTTGYTATMVIHLIAILYNYVTWVCLLISISLAHHYVFIRLMLAVSLKHCTVKIDTGESLSRFVVAQSSKWTYSCLGSTYLSADTCAVFCGHRRNGSILLHPCFFNLRQACHQNTWCLYIYLWLLASCIAGKTWPD